MSNIFISYSRKDIEFARKIVLALAENDLDTWIDWQSIPKGEDWEQEIYRGIEAAETFVFLMSVDSVRSEMCNKEIAHAKQNNKRVIPIVIGDADPDEFLLSISRDEIKRRNWILCRNQYDDFERVIHEIIQTARTNYEWLRYHTKSQVRALEWERSGHERSLLLHGKELENAESQFATNSSKEPQPTELQREYVLQSRQWTNRQRGAITGITIAAFTVLVALTVFALIQSRLATTNASRAQNNASTAEAASTLAVSNALTAVANEEQARLQAKISRADELAAQAVALRNTKFNLSLLLSVEAFKLYDNAQTRSVLAENVQSHMGLEHFLSGHSGKVYQAVFSHNSRLVASGAEDKRILLWDVSDRHHPNIVATLTSSDIVTSLALSPDDTLLASNGFLDNRIILWHVADPANIEQVSTLDTSDIVFKVDRGWFGGGGDLTDIDFNPRGNLLAASNYEGVIALWELSNPREPRELNFYLNGYAVSFSPNGNVLATGDLQNNIELWDITNPSSPLFLSTFSAAPVATPMIEFITKIIFSADGNLIVASNGSSTSIWSISNLFSPVRLSTVEGGSPALTAASNLLAVANSQNIDLWDVSNILDLQQPVRIQTLTGHGDDVVSVDIDKNYETLLSSGADGKSVLWNIHETSNPLGTVVRTAYTGGINEIKMIRKRNIMVTCGDTDGLVTIWDLANNKVTGNVIQFDTDSKYVSDIDVNEEGTVVATTSDDGRIKFWNITSLTAPKYVSSVQSELNTSRVYFNSSGDLLASGDFQGTILLWDLSNLNSPTMLAKIQANPGRISEIGITTNDQVLVSGGYDGSIAFWDISNPSSAFQLSKIQVNEAQSAISTIQISRDGKILIAGTQGGHLMILDIADPLNPKQLSTFSAHGSWISSIDFHPTLKMFASAGVDNQILLWDISNASHPLQLSALRDSNMVRNVIFGVDGTTLISNNTSFNNDNGSINIWTIEPKVWLNMACSVAGGNFTHVEWSQYFPNEPYPTNQQEATCPQWPSQ
jgi:WD40 repeat protein